MSNMEFQKLEIKPTEIMKEIREHSNVNNSDEDVLELSKAIAQKNFQEYSKVRQNYSPETDEIMDKIKNGHVPNKIEVFTLMCDEPEKIEKYKMMEELRERVKDGVISEADFEYLIGAVGLDSDIGNLLRQQFILKGILISEYQKDEIERTK